MNKDLFIEKVFDLWCKENKVETWTIEFVTYKPITPYFGSYDAWKLASPDDYYDETNHSVFVDIEKLNEYMNNCMKDEYNFDELLEEYGTEDEILSNMKLEFFSYFNNWYSNFEEQEINLLSESYDD